MNGPGLVRDASPFFCFNNLVVDVVVVVVKSRPSYPRHDVDGVIGLRLARSSHKPLARPWRNSNNIFASQGRLFAQQPNFGFLSIFSISFFLKISNSPHQSRLSLLAKAGGKNIHDKVVHLPDESAPLLDDPSKVFEVIWKRASKGVPPAELVPTPDPLPESADDFFTDELTVDEDDLRTLPVLLELLLLLLLTTSDPELRRVFCLCCCCNSGLPADVALLPLVEQTSSPSQSLDPQGLA